MKLSESIILKIGFSINFVRLIMKCVASVRVTVKVNGELLSYFTLSHDLRQGCPISQFLFLLRAEGLSSLPNSYGGYIDRGIRVSFISPWVSHLLFTDDCLIFIQANNQSATRLNEILSF